MISPAYLWLANLAIFLLWAMIGLAFFVMLVELLFLLAAWSGADIKAERQELILKVRDRSALFPLLRGIDTVLSLVLLAAMAASGHFFTATVWLCVLAGYSFVGKRWDAEWRAIKAS